MIENPNSLIEIYAQRLMQTTHDLIIAQARINTLQLQIEELQRIASLHAESQNEQ